MRFKIPSINIKSILLYYSTILATILIVSGFFIAKSKNEIISNLLFLPVFFYLWINLIQNIKNKRNKKTNI